VTGWFKQSGVAVCIQDDVIVSIAQLPLPASQPTILGSLVCWPAKRKVAELRSVGGEHAGSESHAHQVAPVFRSVAEECVQVDALGVLGCECLTPVQAQALEIPAHASVLVCRPRRRTRTCVEVGVDLCPQLP